MKEVLFEDTGIIVYVEDGILYEADDGYSYEFKDTPENRAECIRDAKATVAECNKY